MYIFLFQLITICNIFNVINQQINIQNMPTGKRNTIKYFWYLYTFSYKPTYLY